jgi:4-methyl-5(b-hydroxyethyl)-thiazole monophosphate biosynthesis
MMTRRVLVPVADGTEELEAVAIIDVLRRAGAAVTVASVDGLTITASRGTRLVADALLTDCQDQAFDLIALPGGLPGAERLRDDAALTRMLQRHQSQGNLFGAICAAPVLILHTHGLLEGLRATAHPGFSDRLPDQSRVAERVVVDGSVVTSRGAGTAVEFALALVDRLYGPEKAAQVAAAMVAPGPRTIVTND